MPHTPIRTPIQDEAHWHTLRRRHVGASEVAALFYRWRLPDGSETYRHLFAEIPPEWTLIECVSPYTSGVRLYYEKTGRLEPEAAGNARTEAGQYMEPAIAAWAKARTGWDIRKEADYLAHPEISGMGASLDYWIPDHPHGPAAMDCKDVSSWAWREWTGGEVLEPPLHIVLQVQQQMAVTGYPHGLAAAYAAGIDLFLVEIARNAAIIAMLEEAVTAFWQSVKEKQEPNPALDAPLARELWAETESGKQLDLSDDTAFLQLVTTWERSRTQVRDYEAGARAACDDILLRMQDAGWEEATEPVAFIEACLRQPGRSPPGGYDPLAAKTRAIEALEELNREWEARDAEQHADV